MSVKINATGGIGIQRTVSLPRICFAGRIRRTTVFRIPTPTQGRRIYPWRGNGSSRLAEIAAGALLRENMISETPNSLHNAYDGQEILQSLDKTYIEYAKEIRGVRKHPAPIWA